MTAANMKPASPGRLQPHLREKLLQIKPQPIVQIAGMALADPEVIPLHFGESDIPTAEFISRAAFDALQRGETFYTHRRGIPELRHSLSRYMSRLYDRPIDSERITVTPSAMQALMLSMMSALEEDDLAVDAAGTPGAVAASGLPVFGAAAVPLFLLGAW